MNLRGEHNLHRWTLRHWGHGTGQGHTADRWQGWDQSLNLPWGPSTLTLAYSPSGGMEVRWQVASEKCVPGKKIATRGRERAADAEDWEALGTGGPESSCCSHQLIKEEPEIQIFFFKGWLHFLNRW